MNKKDTIIAVAVAAVSAAAIVAAKIIAGKRCERAITQLSQEVEI